LAEGQLQGYRAEGRFLPAVNAGRRGRRIDLFECRVIFSSDLAKEEIDADLRIPVQGLLPLFRAAHLRKR
jgi:hypothetical protein